MRRETTGEVGLAELAKGVSALTKGFFFFVIVFKIFAVLAIFIMTLLMCNSYTIQFTHLKYTVPNSMIFSVFTEFVQ